MALFRHLMFVAALTAAGATQAQVTVRGTTTATATTAGIQFRAAGTVAAEGSGDTNPDPTIPAGTVAGDLLICIIESRDNVAHTMPAGWTQLSTATSGTQHRASLFWKWAVAGEAAPNIGHPGGNAVIARIVGFSGVDVATAFDQAMAGELARSRRYRQPLSAAMIDIDRFKRVNDTFGHATGDTVLKELVAVARSCVRTADLLVRWGGEEFLLLMPFTAHRVAAMAAEKLRKAV